MEDISEGLSKLDSIAYAINSVTGVSKDLLRYKTRRSDISDAKIIFTHLAFYHDFKRIDIQNYLEEEDHCIIFWRRKRANNLFEVDKKFKRLYDRVKEVAESNYRTSAMEDLNEEIESTRKHLSNLMAIRDKIAAW